ncbi:[protein-PII] uridylyltransferase [Nitrospira moscoviensis]|uniref:Bifunctional uridylyltransferase/uridylyl-removing enzyme n=1 Tax=Nitrospira moscoviensis TaxID=42253 RepID=A0A0K2GAR8_NITMO|nr:[protein-PII] uridylyltransferase [Nitrospira moscoviensis]ALA57697.1 putative (Protein-PII) uridylyltransferase GlnD [Nitrospira moscoviensis]
MPDQRAVALHDADGATVGAVLAEQRQAIAQRLMEGASGTEIVAAQTDLVDGLIIGRYRNAARQGDEAVMSAAFQHCCLVALGGYGRREMAPYSDVDLMVLYRPEVAKIVPEFVRQVLHPLWDVGFQVGHSVRTIQDCLSLGLTDVTVRTSMMEARFLTGNPQLFQEFHSAYLRKVATAGVDRYLDLKLNERQREYEKFGETVYLLEPNVKKSKGGLRDLHVLQWAGLARYQAPTIRELSDRGILSRQDYVTVSEAREFLLRVRSLLHVHAGMAQEILSFDEQVWLAERFGFQNRPHLLAVEQFMQQYYRHTVGLHEASVRFIRRCRSQSWWARIKSWLPAPALDTHFVLNGETLTVPAEARPRVLESPALLMRLFDLARSRRLSIDTALLEDIHRHVEGLSDRGFRDPEVSRTFVQILAGPGTAQTLEAMHRAHLLEKIIPVFATVRGLMQFNQYHKYTVDEHSLLAVAKVEALNQDNGVLGDVYREIKRKDLLHLAVLLHDLGKGQEEDHSEAGRRIAEEAAARLGFDEADGRTLTFLVHRHLLMAHTAFRRDPNDERVVLPFAREVGTPEVLRKLLALTAADIAAVGPGVLTKWKESLLIELYLRTIQEVSGEREAAEAPERLKRIVADVLGQPPLRGNPDVSQEWVEAQLGQFPLRYAYGTAPKRIAAQLDVIRRLSPGDVLVSAEFNASLGTCEYAVTTFNDLIPGIFSKLAGVMAANGLQILDAQIMTRQDGIVVDTFQVTDPDYAGAPPADRLESVGDMICAVLKGTERIEDVVRRGTRLSAPRVLPAARQATEVRIDNETSDRYTIVDVFADDRQGLLYVITHAIFAQGLSVHAARISTRLDQVADVFYVTDADGRKIEDPAQIERIRQGLRQHIETFLGAIAA